jgi:hypothetical protein
MLTLGSDNKWPNVPDVYNWLELDNRGNWCIKNEKISHKGLIKFINDHYSSDDKGRWFFQNGPQRVFVKLHSTPFILSIALNNDVIYFKTQTNQVIQQIEQFWLDNNGRLLLSWGQYLGLLSDRDLLMMSDYIVPVNANGQQEFDQISDLDIPSSFSENKIPFNLKLNNRLYDIRPIRERDFSRLFNFEPNPAPPVGSPDC